ncbi:hypothetical protein [Cohaesibacter celericrescens]|uniref:Uncharacterized protein n=1 Tax=Cohaesibacter celericrescens TaxID=2067669 RepID=A0A2N5XQA8_9HYPH|nr:hypothetical protein [Cohaesibacter celericrescens]PLW76683.1 hypothetical protein C0081_11450 [Cohaesibacter celericrescens]
MNYSMKFLLASIGFFLSLSITFTFSNAKSIYEATQGIKIWEGIVEINYEKRKDRFSLVAEDFFEGCQLSVIEIAKGFDKVTTHLSTKYRFRRLKVSGSCVLKEIKNGKFVTLRSRKVY